EVYNSFSLPLNLGIGGAVAKLTSLDWQTHDFVPGSLITVRLDNMTNIPDGMDWGVIDGNLINIAVGPSDDSGTGRSMHVWRSTVSKANYRFFMVRISGNPGSRTITTRRVPIIDEAQTWGAKQTFSAGLSGELSGNASTATKLKTARKINSVSFDGSKDINLTPEDIDALPITGGTLTGGLTVDGEIVSKSGNGFRIVQGNYGFFIRNDGSNTYFMLTNSGDSLGTWSSLRPFAINNANGAVSIGNGLNVTGDTVSSSRVRAGNGKKFSISSSNSSTKEATFNLWGNSSRPVVAELGDDSGWHFYSQRNTDNSITFAVNGQISPSDYSNFDSRYVKDVRLGSQQYYGVNNWQTWNFQCPSGHVLSGINVQDTGSNSADNIAGVYYRPVQKYINGTWYNVASV
ncbi:phage tail fiber protein, partial [Escherichia coli]